MAFGPKDAPATFQHVMNTILSPFLNKFVFVCLDDSFIYPKHFVIYMRNTWSIWEAYCTCCGTTNCIAKGPMPVLCCIGGLPWAPTDPHRPEVDPQKVEAIEISWNGQLVVPGVLPLLCHTSGHSWDYCSTTIPSWTTASWLIPEEADRLFLKLKVRSIAA